MLEQLLFGLPGQQPGGLVLTVLYFVGSALVALAAGYAYAVASVALGRAGIALQLVCSVLRGIPLLLLIFFFANVSWLTVPLAGLLGLSLYSLSHVGEVLRGFLSIYPRALKEQSRSMGVGLLRDWLELRFVWTVSRSVPALVTHWVSLLKDTGALVILGIGELTTVAKLLGETAFDLGRWSLVLLSAAFLYLVATLTLIKAAEWVASGLGRWKSPQSLLVSE